MNQNNREARVDVSTNSHFNYKQIESAVNALYKYLEKSKQESNTVSNFLWDDVRDINLLIEPKLRLMKAKEYRAFRIPLIHSWRQAGGHETCIITRTKDVPLWEDILLTKFPVAGVTKIIGLKEFKTSFAGEKARQNLCNYYDLFIVHPLIVHFVTSKLVGFLKKQNKSLAVLPFCTKLFDISNESGLLLKHSDNFKKSDWETKMGENAPQWMIESQLKLQASANERRMKFLEFKKQRKQARIDAKARKKKKRMENENKNTNTETNKNKNNSAGLDDLSSDEDNDEEEDIDIKGSNKKTMHTFEDTMDGNSDDADEMVNQEKFIDDHTIDVPSNNQNDQKSTENDEEAGDSGSSESSSIVVGMGDVIPLPPSRDDSMSDNNEQDCDIDMKQSKPQSKKQKKQKTKVQKPKPKPQPKPQAKQQSKNQNKKGKKKNKKKKNKSRISQNDGTNDNISSDDEDKKTDMNVDNNNNNDSDIDMEVLAVEFERQRKTKNRKKKNNKKSVKYSEMCNILADIGIECKETDWLDNSNLMQSQSNNDSRMEYKGQFANGERLARLIAKYRDSTYYTNFCNNHRFIKIGDTSQSKIEIYENLTSVLNIGPQLFPNGGLDNIMRMSLHLNNSIIQLPFYHSTQPNPCFTLIQEKEEEEDGEGLNVKKTMKMKNEEILKLETMKQQVKMKTKMAMQYTIPIGNLSNVEHIQQCKLPTNNSLFE